MSCNLVPLEILMNAGLYSLLSLPTTAPSLPQPPSHRYGGTEAYNNYRLGDDRSSGHDIFLRARGYDDGAHSPRPRYLSSPRHLDVVQRPERARADRICTSPSNNFQRDNRGRHHTPRQTQPTTKQQPTKQQQTNQEKTKNQNGGHLG